MERALYWSPRILGAVGEGAAALDVLFGLAWGRFPPSAYLAIAGPQILAGILFYLHFARLAGAGPSGGT